MDEYIPLINPCQTTTLPALGRRAIKLSVLCGISVDGFLARPDHALDFLDAGGQEPHGFEECYGSVDVVVIGRK